MSELVVAQWINWSMVAIVVAVGFVCCSDSELSAGNIVKLISRASNRNTLMICWHQRMWDGSGVPMNSCS